MPFLHTPAVGCIVQLIKPPGTVAGVCHPAPTDGRPKGCLYAHSRPPCPVWLCAGNGPVKNLMQHLEDPFSANAWSYATKFTPSI